MWRAKTIGSCFISFLLLTKSLTVSLIGTPHIVANYPHFTTLVQPDSSPKNPLWRWRVEQFTEFYESLRELVSSGPRTLLQFSSVQSSRSVVSDFLWPHEPQHARPPCPSPTPGVHPNSCPLSRWCHTTVYLILCHPLLLLPSVFPSIRIFSNESALRMRWPKYWSFSFNFSPSNEHPGLISFKMDWLDLFAVQGTLKSLLQHHSSKVSILRLSAFFIVQLSHPYVTIGRTIALTRRTFVDKVMSLLFNMLSRLVIALIPRSKHLLISKLLIGLLTWLRWEWLIWRMQATTSYKTRGTSYIFRVLLFFIFSFSNSTEIKK